MGVNRPTINISPIWNPSNGRDITTLCRNTTNGIYKTFRLGSGYKEIETSGIYIGNFGIDYGQSQTENNPAYYARYRVNDFIVNMSSGQHSYAYCFLQKVEDGKYTISLKMSENGGPIYDAHYIDFSFYESYYNYLDVFRPEYTEWTRVTNYRWFSSSPTSISIGNGTPISSYYDVGYNTWIQKETFVNINMPYFPVFDDEGLMTAYLRDPENPENYTRALNYYDPSDTGYICNKLKTQYRQIYNAVRNIKAEIFNHNISNYSDFNDNVLNKINTLIQNGKIIDLETPIQENVNKVENDLTKFISLKSLNLVNRSTVNDRQVGFPNKEPFIPSKYYTPFTDEQFSTIIDFFDNEYETITNKKGYYLIIYDSYTDENDNLYYVIGAMDFENYNNDTVYSNRVLDSTNSSSSSSPKKPEYYFYLSTGTSGNINRVWIRDTSRNAIQGQLYIYDITNDNIYEKTESTVYFRSLQGHDNYIVLNKVNKDVPFYCSTDMYVAYRSSTETGNQWKNYLFLKKSDTLNIDISPVNAAVVQVKPVIMLYNRYEFSFLNNWDGNKIELGDYYMIAPQIGAGIKENDNSFSGVVLGTKIRDINYGEGRLMGIFGQYHGRQSFFLNSDDGSAIFGLERRGQITMDPTQNKAMIYSGNYWKDFKYDGKPVNYNDSNMAKQGMLIDLTTPQIRFGNGNFVVDANGNTTIAGGGGLAGWKITDTTIESNINASQGRMVIDSGATVSPNLDEHGNKTYTYSFGRIYAGNHTTFSSTSDGFYLSKEGLSIGSKFSVSAAGIINATDANLSGTINVLGNAASRIGNWTVNSDNLYSKIVDGSGNGYDITIGSNGNMFGYELVNNIQTNLMWEIKKTGECYFKNFSGNVPSGKSLTVAGNLTVSGKITAANGNVVLQSTNSTIGGFAIGSDRFGSQTIGMYTDGSLYCKTLSASSSITVSGGFSTTGSSGTITASGNISTSGTLSSTGALSCGAITSTGGGTFNGALTTGNYAITCGNLTGARISGTSIDASSIGSTLLTILDDRYLQKTAVTTKRISYMTGCGSSGGTLTTPVSTDSTTVLIYS